MPRTTTVKVWVAALPPMLATIVMKAARATTSSIVAWNDRTTKAAKIAVTKLMPSQGSRFFHASPADVDTCSSLETPAIR